MAHRKKTAPMLRNRLARFAGTGGLALLVASCSGPTVDPAFINRDAASRCVKHIDTWKKEVVKLDSLEREFDSAAEQIRINYRSATPEERIELRARLNVLITQTDETRKSADELFSEIVRELEYVPRDKTIRAKIALVTGPLKDSEGLRTPEVLQAMDAVASQLQVLVRMD